MHFPKKSWDSFSTFAGNPTSTRWDCHRATGCSWRVSRMRYRFHPYDATRIDHFRGFDEYFSIPYGAESAVSGHWEKGPGIELFRNETINGWFSSITSEEQPAARDNRCRMNWYTT